MATHLLRMITTTHLTDLDPRAPVMMATMEMMAMAPKALKEVMEAKAPKVAMMMMTPKTMDTERGTLDKTHERNSSL
jgi:hypothetical protein